MLFGHRSHPLFVSLLSQRLKSGDFVFMQDSTVHHAVHNEPRQLRMNFETFLILQWNRCLAALQRSGNRMVTNSAHFQLNAC